MRVLSGIVALFICLGFPIHSILFPKNSSQKIVSLIKSKGWWETKIANQQLTFSPSEFQEIEWEDEHEFILDDEYYDVIEHVDSCGYSILKVYKDFNDTQWNHQKNISGQQENKSKSNPSIPLTWICKEITLFPFKLLKKSSKSSIEFQSLFFDHLSPNPHFPPPKGLI